MKKSPFSICFQGLLFLFLICSNTIAQSPVIFQLSNTEAAVGESACIEVSIENFNDVISLQLPLKWDPLLLNMASISNETLTGAISNIDQSKGELRYLWEDPTLSNPISLADNTALFEFCFSVIDGKGEDTPISIESIEIPLFETLVLDSNVNELAFEVSNGIVSIADDCNGIAIFPEAVCQNEQFTLGVDLSAMGNSISNFGHWIIDGHIVDPMDEGNNIPDSNGSVFIQSITSLFDANYNDQIVILLEDTQAHTFQFFYDFINCSGFTEEFTIQANPEPQTLDLDIPSEVCYSEDLVLDFEYEQSGNFNLDFSFNGTGDDLEFNSDSDTLSFLDLINDFELNFNRITNLETGCFTENIQPEEIEITILDELILSLTDSLCNDNGTYTASYELMGGSGDFQVITNSNGELDSNIYMTNLLEPDETDTITIVDNFCQETDITFFTNIACSCVDSATVFDINTIISCSSDIIQPILVKEAFTGLENPVTFFRIFTRDALGMIDEIVFDTLVFDEMNPEIPFSPLFENGVTYFAEPLLSERINGSIDLNYRCINEIVTQVFSFRYYHNPEPNILGEQSLCMNQLEARYEIEMQDNSNSYEWDVDGGATLIPNGSVVFLNVEGSTPITLSVIETFNPIDIVDNLSCVGQAQINIDITNEVASDKIEIILFPGGFFSAVGPDDACYQWYAISKATGDVVIEGPDSKFWALDEDVDLENLVYVVEVSNPQNGSCDQSTCPTLNYFNSPGPVATSEIDISEIEIFPNPASTHLILRHQNIKVNDKVILFNSIGVLQSIYVQKQNGAFQLNTSKLEDGVYFVSLVSSTNEFLGTIRFVKL